jgi:hypothetical protein
VISQTDGPSEGTQYVPCPIDWQKERALSVLDVTEAPFEAVNGNIMGYAKERSVAISPLNPHPIKTLFHELAHVLLGHTAEAQQTDGADMPRNLQEAEAEAVALVCCDALNLPGADHCRGYIQKWWGHGNPIPERSAQRVLRVADQILRAGRTDDDATIEGGRP